MPRPIHMVMHRPPQPGWLRDQPSSEVLLQDYLTRAIALDPIMCRFITFWPSHWTIGPQELEILLYLYLFYFFCGIGDY